MFRVLISPTVPSHSSRPQNKSCERAPEVFTGVQPGARNKKQKVPILSTKSETDTDPDIQFFTPSPPVIIPTPGCHNASLKKKQVIKRRGNDQSLKETKLSTNTIPLSPATILAITSIPPWRKRSGIRPHNLVKRANFELCDDESTEDDCASAHGLVLSHGEHPFEILLTPPDNDGDNTESDDSQGSFRSRSSCASFSSSSISSAGSTSSYKSPTSPVLAESGFNFRQTGVGRKRRGLTCQTPKECAPEDHPLFVHDVDAEEYILQDTPQIDEIIDEQTEFEHRKQPKLSLKSNFTASFQALKRVAKSISSLPNPVIIPDDFLTRSIIHSDSKANLTHLPLPHSQENGPPSALRLCMKSTINIHNEASTFCSASSPFQTGKCTASIQMQTLKLSGSSRRSLSNRRIQFARSDNIVDVTPMHVNRQREARENSDFMRVAVIEMSMRKCGKLDDQKPGRARYVLPPRKVSTKPYAITEGGVPLRWIAFTL
ncbi:hypothetical protein K3495_g4981 [Podosphaera aphanis]|nr:hypothetical protein K3495_g4981 [Podosphaera aphanis]